MDSSSPYMLFDRTAWAALRYSEPMTLTPKDLEALSGINDELSVDEVQQVHLPLSRLLNYYIDAQASRQAVLSKFLTRDIPKVPFIISIAGSVSVGKSTTARVLQALLQKRDEKAHVALVTTDGFLYSNSVLETKGILLKKGFPESYDIKRLLEFVTDVKSGKRNVEAPIYSHLIYNVVPNKHEVVDSPDILIIEGLNVLQSGMNYHQDKPRVFVSDFVDFSIYVDAEEDLLEEWYVARFLKFREGAFANPVSYFHGYTKLSDKEAAKTARIIWREINRKNLRKNILPTRERASLILHKGANHAVDYVRLRK